MAEIRVYDESSLQHRLARLDRAGKTAFAAACAERLLPAFERYARSVGDPSRWQRLSEIVSAAWDLAAGQIFEAELLKAQAERLIPGDEEEWVPETGYAENAAAAAAYAIGTWLDDSPQDAVWAGRQLYEAADYAYLQGHRGTDPNIEGAEAAVLGSGVVQSILEALERDLVAVESSPGDWTRLRERSRTEGRSWTADLP